MMLPQPEQKPEQMIEKSFTPREVVSELDKFIVGQEAAKKAVAIALRNRWRRKRVSPALRDEIAPKNIILIGATGVGKTEIARRLAKLAQAPFVKVEASKFTEVGYVGRDVDSMVRDLVESAIQMVRDEEKSRTMIQAKSLAEERVLDLLLPKKNETNTTDSSRENLRHMLRNGELSERLVDIEVQDNKPPIMQVFSNTGMEEMGMNIQEMLGNMVGGQKTKKRRVPLQEAIDTFTQEEAQKLIDHEFVTKEAIRRAEDMGIIFLDEIDKIARREGSGQGPDVSREGVQRDILPIVEGSTVNTKYGMVRTDHVLFIAAGAFHVSRVSDLIPELQGRFPIRVELEPLGEAELLRILKEPQNALPVQYTALLQTENVTLSFSEDGLQAIAHVAAEANSQAENIGARRLHTIFERLLEDVSFNAPERGGSRIDVDAAYVQKTLEQFLQSDDLKRYIL